MHYKKNVGDIIFDVVVYFLVAILLLATLYPLIYVFSMSISDPLAAARGDVWLFPVGFSLTSIKRVLSDQEVLRYYWNTIRYTVMATVCHVIVTALAAYPLSRPEFRMRKAVTKFIMLTMFFGGGTIPTYIVVSNFLGLYGNPWVMVILGLTNAYHIMIAKNFFASLPGELIESARIDGAAEFHTFWKIVLPLSKPVLAVVALYKAIAVWNGYFNAMLYLPDKKLQPLSMYIRKVIMQNNISSLLDGEAISADVLLSSLQLKYSVILVSVLPMICMYPFLSKYFQKGLMVGSVKG